MFCHLHRSFHKIPRITSRKLFRVNSPLPLYFVPLTKSPISAFHNSIFGLKNRILIPWIPEAAILPVFNPKINRAKNPLGRRITQPLTPIVSPEMEVKKEPLIITDKNEMRQWSRTMRAQGKTIGLVPTMGYLHEGHLSLIRESNNHTHLTVVSIYVNPGQFSPSEDLSTYPSDFNGDINKLKSVPGGVDVVFHPYNLYDYVGGGGWVEREGKGEKEVGEGGGGVVVVSCVEERGVGHETWVRVERLEKGMCGKSRSVFFRGVATVVAKLFNIVEPDVALFGKKD